MSDIEQEDAEAGMVLEPLAIIRSVLNKVKRYPWLMAVLMAFYGSLALLIAALVQPVYTAEATAGPPTSSLSASAMSSAASSLSGLAAKLGGGGLFGGSQSDPFSQYTELLTSNRLAAVLAKKKGFLEKIFYTKYDIENKRWYPRDGILFNVGAELRSIFHYPVKKIPDQDDLQTFLNKNMNVSTSLTSSFITVTLSFNSPTEAENILNTILTAADNIVRADMRADVEARLVYLNRALPQITQSDQRDTLISLLSTQEQQMMVIAADEHFASALIDPPRASLTPSFPSILKFGAMAFLLAIGSWAGAVYLLSPDHRLLRWFARRPRSSGGEVRVGPAARFARWRRRSESW